MNKIEEFEELNTLYKQFCQGNLRAQNALYEMTASRLFNYINSKADLSLEVVGELMQETWLKLWQACSKNHKELSFNTRMYRIAQSLTIDQWRSEKRTKKRTTYEEELAEKNTDHGKFQKTISMDSSQKRDRDQVEWSFSANDIQDDAGILYDLKRVVSELPLLQRQAWILMQEGLTNEEIAELTSSEPEAVKSRIRYANSKIKKILESGK